jgi:hypothetical protein
MQPTKVPPKIAVSSLVNRLKGISTQRAPQLKNLPWSPPTLRRVAAVLLSAKHYWIINFFRGP